MTRSPEYAKELDRIRRVYDERALTDYGDRYTYFDPGNLFLTQDREAAVLCALRRSGFSPLTGRDILEVGCGTGQWLRQFVQWGADPERLVGIELDPVRVAQARRLSPASVRILEGDAAETGIPSGSFDLVYQSVVFTSILNMGVRRALAREMLRLLKPQGIALWYDFRVDNPHNPDVQAVGRAEIRELFAQCDISFRSVGLAPFLARRIAPFSRVACEVLGLIPGLNTHVLAVICPRAPVV